MEVIKTLRLRGKKAKVPRRILAAFVEVLEKYLNGGGGYVSPAYITSIKKAIIQQQRIGVNMMARGFLARGWMDALEENGVDKPERKMEALQLMLWDVVVQPLWHTRNHILHRTQNKHHAVESERLGERIKWYVKHKHRLLSVYDRYLARFDISTIHRMDRHTRAAWVRHLDVAREAYNNELRQKAQGRNVITRYCTFRTLANKCTQPGPAEEELQSEFFIGPTPQPNG